MVHDPCILILDDEPAILDMFLLSLAPKDWALGDGRARTPCVVTATSGVFASTRFLVATDSFQAFALVEAELAAGRKLSGGFFDLHLAQGLQGPEVMRGLRGLQPGLLCTVVTGLQGEFESVLAVFAPDHLDEWDFVCKPFARAEVVQRCRQMIAAALRRAREAEGLLEIQRLNKELELWARSLERRVAQRTEQLASAMHELKDKNEELESVLGALNETQAQLVQHEKMATIGQLSAGVARELSRPLAFSQQALAGICRGVERLAEFAAHVEELASPRPEASAEHAEVRAAFGGICRTLRPSVSGAEATALLVHAEDGIDRASSIVRELAAFAAPSTERTPTDVSHTLGAAIELIRGSLQRGEHVDADLGNLSCVEGNGGELQHAWLQLLRNAVEATSARTGDARIRVRARQQGDEVIVEFTDNGEGIADELRDLVFEPFFSTRGRKTGLGLSIVHGVVSRHGGTIEVEPALPVGTIIRVHLPAARAAHAGCMAAAERADA